jgi:hypothetical protein
MPKGGLSPRAQSNGLARQPSRVAPAISAYRVVPYVAARFKAWVAIPISRQGTASAVP